MAYAGPGDHIRTGNLTITPAIGVTGNYRTNVFLQAGELGGEPVTSGAYIGVEPSLGVAAAGGESYGLDLGATYSAKKYLSSELSNLDRFKDIDLDARLGVLPVGLVGLDVSEGFFISSRETEAISSDDAYIQRLHSATAASLAIRPGSSLEAGLGGRLERTNYQTPSAELITRIEDSASLNSRWAYGPTIDIGWKFFPQTALIFGFEYMLLKWDTNFFDLSEFSASTNTGGTTATGTTTATGSEGSTSSGDYTAVPDATSTKYTLGLRGRLTEKLVLTLIGGYNAIKYDEQSVIEEAASEGADVSGDSGTFGADLAGLPSGLIADIELTYSVRPGHTFLVGYNRSFADVYFTNFVGYHALTGRYSGKFFGRVRTNLAGTYRLEDYQGALARTDHTIRVTAELGYTIGEALEIELGSGWSQRAASADSSDKSNDYDDINIYGGLTFTY